MPTTTLETLARLMAQTTGCPICHYGRATGQVFLENLLYESVNDFGIRQQLTQRLGFCALHSREMLQLPGARLGAAILEQAMLKEALRRLEDLVPARRSLLGHRRALGSSPPSQQNCLVCEHERQNEIRAIEDLVGHWDDAWAEALENVGGLCYNHLHQAIRLSPNKTIAAQLKTSHQRLWQTTIARLDAFIRKHDYRFRDEPIQAEEAQAIHRAIAILTGEDA